MAGALSIPHRERVPLTTDRRLRRVLAAAGAALLPAGCLGGYAPSPPISESTSNGIVRAHSTATTLEVAGWLQQGQFSGNRLAEYPRSGLSLLLGFPGGRLLELSGDAWRPREAGS